MGQFSKLFVKTEFYASGLKLFSATIERAHGMDFNEFRIVHFV